MQLGDDRLLVREVVVERHRLDAERLTQATHAEPLDAVRVEQLDGLLEVAEPGRHALSEVPRIEDQHGAFLHVGVDLRERRLRQRPGIRQNRPIDDRVVSDLVAIDVDACGLPRIDCRSERQHLDQATQARLADIVDRGVDWFRQFGTEKSPGFKLWAVSGHVNNPGIFEAPLGITMRELLGYAGGMRDGRKVKFWLPGGSSVPMLTDEHLDLPLTYEDMAAAGTMLGTGTPMIFDETTSVVKAVSRWLHFYKHESCGKCTPCREGTFWISSVLKRLEKGKGNPDDIQTLLDLCKQLGGRSFCALGDAAATPFPAAMKYFRHEFEAGMSTAADDTFAPSAAFVGASA